MEPEEDYLEQKRAGLELLKNMATEVEVGDRDPKTQSYQLLLRGKIAGWVSEDFVADLPNTPGYREIFLKGLETIRRESSQINPRIVLVSESGVGFRG